MKRFRSLVFGQDSSKIGRVLEKLLCVKRLHIFGASTMCIFVAGCTMSKSPCLLNRVRVSTQYEQSRKRWKSDSTELRFNGFTVEVVCVEYFIVCTLVTSLGGQ